MENTENLHAHFETTMTDCDGRMDRDYVYTPNEGEDDYDFKSRVLMSLVSWSNENRVVFKSGETDGYAWETIEVSYTHDEGKFYGEATICQDATCDLGEQGQRDHFAEAMGY